MEKRKVIICRGIQGSGKSTWAKLYCEKEPECRIRFNKDDIRNMFGKYWVTSREDIVQKTMEAGIFQAMKLGYNIVIDNMNLNPKEVNAIKDVMNMASNVNYDYEIEFRNFPLSLETCIARDAKRENPIGSEAITKTYNKYKEVLESWNQK